MRRLLYLGTSHLLSSDFVHREIDELLLLGKATSASEAEQMWLDSHLPDIALLSSRKESGPRNVLSDGKDSRRIGTDFFK